MRTLLAALTALLLLLPVAAHAGGFATAGVLNPPEGVGPGETWNARIEILQHGRTPMENLTPAVVVGGERFAATPVDGKPGVYEAAVVFPTAGRVRYSIDDGFTNAEPHEFVADIGTATSPAASDGFPWLPLTGAALAALAVAYALRRRRSAVPA
jgi:hypothetical protein